MHFLHRAVITLAGLFLASSFPLQGLAETLIQYGGSPGSSWMGPDMAVGWQQSSSVQNVTISATLDLFPGLNPRATVTAYLTTALGPGTGSTHLVSESTVLIGGDQGTSSSYNLFSGLTLSPGSYYLTVAEPYNIVGWLSSSSPNLHETSDFNYLGSFSVNGARGVVDPYAPASNFYLIEDSYSPPSYGLLFSVSGDPVVDSRVSAVPEPNAIGLVVLGAAACMLVGIGRKHYLLARDV